MSYRIEVLSSAQKEILALPGYVRAQARQMIGGLREDPRPAQSKQLRDRRDIYRLWLAGRWRIAYQVDDDLRRIRVLRVRLKEHIDYESL